ncbi:MAG: acyl-CoA dehydratase activase [Gracilibacteraceae bacterium]|jgi:benzoyl-CoA reductase subunit D|nr:acyl-CoA dehydratase activase [Gracilibacteraceae bacterium]
MITVGIDSGSQNIKAVALQDGAVVARAKILAEFDAVKAAEAVYELVLRQAGLTESDVEAVAATGAGRALVPFAVLCINEVSSASKGARMVRPGAEVVIDLGAESSRAIRLQPDGKVKKYEINDKCASGAGTFIETMARALQMEIEDMGPYSLRHTREVPMNAQCVVFAESEVVSLIHQQESKENIAYAIHMGIANRVGALFRRLGLSDELVLIGGPALNVGLVECMGKESGRKIFVPEYPDFISAMAAAAAAAENARGGVAGG